MKTKIISFLMLCALSTGAIGSVAYSTEAQESRVAAIQPAGHVYSSEELGDSLFATHLTSEFPENLVIKAHRVVRDDSFPSAYKVNKDVPRGGNFWALGSPIHDHTGASFNDHNFGIVLPFRELYGQLLNVCPSDVFTLGDFDLKKAQCAHLFMPEGTDLNNVERDGIVIHTYKGDLRKAMMDFLVSLKVWQVTLKEKSGEEFSYKDTAMLADTNININTPDFFKSLLADKPHVSYGKETVSNIPRDGILAQIRMLADIQNLVEQRIYYPGNRNDLTKFNIEPYVVLVSVAIKNLREIFQVKKTHPLSAYAGPLLEQLDLFSKYLDMLDVELRIKKENGLFCLDLYNVFLKDLHQKKIGRTRLVESPKAMDEYVKAIRAKYNTYRPGEQSIDNLAIIDTYLINLPPELAEEYFAHPGMKSRAPLWKNLYWYNRFIRRDYGCEYSGTNSSRENDFLNFQLTLKDVTEYVKRNRLDVNVLFYADSFIRPYDLSVKDDAVINNRVKAITEPELWEVIRDISSFRIIFEDGYREWYIKSGLYRNTQKADGSFALSDMRWGNTEPRHVVGFKDPFNK